MRILSCHIANFGKLHDAQFTFDAGLNEIKAVNGWGKSTLAAFIKAMLYGLEGDGKKDELVSERKRYNPWQGGTFGGTLTFESAGKKYTVSRSFGNKAALDTFELRDADTNLIVNDFSEKIGEELFKINAESFARTVFIGRDLSIYSGTTDDINAKIGNITDGMDLNRFAAIDDRIKNDLNSLSATRKTGEIYKLKEEATNLKAVLRDGSGT
ncbi:MAG: AAA family ATPase, partial [Lachnospiraceae bacterium]|nr:AAA family ATPase [Lachnospiraceae bacterium]